MKWSGRRQSDNIIDKRSNSVGSVGRSRVAGPRLGLGGVVILGLIVYLLGGDPRAVISLLQNEMRQGAVAPSQSSGPQSAFDSNESKGLVSVTLKDLEVRWSDIFQRLGRTYTPTPLVLFRGATDTGCGYGQRASGPFYCPADRHVYLDLSFMEDLQRLGGKGDFSLAYVVAHEVGHHVQTLLHPERMRGRGDQRQAIAIELQADCYAGLWAHHADKERDFLEPGDIEEGLATAAAVGDDHIQRSSGQVVSPESFTHGTSEQRQQAFLVGFRSGDIASCQFAN
ncbi:MAG: neutral zinc metallopeptidase [Pseudomonadota bacterium]|jgi:predicted metalloprotease